MNTFFEQRPTAVTPSFFVDFIDKDNFGGKLPL